MEKQVCQIAAWIRLEAASDDVFRHCKAPNHLDAPYATRVMRERAQFTRFVHFIGYDVSRYSGNLFKTQRFFCSKK